MGVGVPKWTNLNRFPVMARTRARAWWGPMSDVQRGELGPGGPGMGRMGLDAQGYGGGVL